MENAINAIVLGLVEGMTEFLPISSTGHLIIFNQWFNFSGDFFKVFDIFIQGGAILSIVVLYWRDFYDRDILKKLAIAFIPAGVIGFFFGNLIQEKLFNPAVVSLALIVGGVVLIFLEEYFKRGPFSSEFGETGEIKEKAITFRNAFLVGLFQILAFVPGISRAGATIIGGLFAGFSRKQAAKFSFLLAVPTLITASAYSFWNYRNQMQNGRIFILLLGFTVSFLSAYFAVKWFLKYISRHNFIFFGWYRIILGLAVLAMVFFGF